MDLYRLPQLVNELFTISRELESMFPGRHFTPDGHLVGSLGECLAAYHYELELLPASTKGYDAVKGDRKIEIKATLGKRIALRSQPDHLLVLKLFENGSFSEVFNGPGDVVWELVKDRPRPTNGQYQVSLSKLNELMKEVKEDQRITRASG